MFIVLCTFKRDKKIGKLSNFGFKIKSSQLTFTLNFFNVILKLYVNPI